MVYIYYNPLTSGKGDRPNWQGLPNSVGQMKLQVWLTRRQLGRQCLTSVNHTTLVATLFCMSAAWRQTYDFVTAQYSGNFSLFLKWYSAILGRGVFSEHDDNSKKNVGQCNSGGVEFWSLLLFRTDCLLNQLYEADDLESSGYELLLDFSGSGSGSGDWSVQGNAEKLGLTNTIYTDTIQIKIKISPKLSCLFFNTTSLCPTWRTWKPPGFFQCEKCPTDTSASGGGSWCMSPPDFALIFLFEFGNCSIKSFFALFSWGLWIHLWEPVAHRRSGHSAGGQQQESDGEARGLCCSCSRSSYWSGARIHFGIFFDLQIVQKKRRLVHSGPAESFKYVLAWNPIKIIWHSPSYERKFEF